MKTMKYGFLVMLILLSVILIMGSKKDMSTRIEHSDLGREVLVIGSLNHPLGEIIKVKGLVVYGIDLGNKALEGKLFLEVREINGKSLEKEIRVELNYFSWTQIDKPEPGNLVTYTGYETGGFNGIPEDAFQHLPRVATEDYHFRTYFQVCSEE